MNVTFVPDALRHGARIVHDATVLRVEVTGSRAKVKVVKNKVAAPFRQAEFDIGYGEGISKVGELVDLGVDHKLVVKSGAWYSYGDLRLGQGRDNSKTFLRENPDLADELEAKIRERMGMPSLATAPLRGVAAGE